MSDTLFDSAGPASVEVGENFMGGERIRILVVDDMADVTESTTELLTLWGYDARACGSGAAALALARYRRPAAVLLDLAMPRMDGFEVARALHLVPGCEAVPIVALSGHATPEYFSDARSAGIAHYLVKPADPERLKALLVLVTQAPSESAIILLKKRWEPPAPACGAGPRGSGSS